MDSALSLQIQCSVCLGDFTDPVSLPCEHSFCRQCVSDLMQASAGPSLCPECRHPFARRDLRANLRLRNVTGAVREHRRQATLELLCPEHHNKLDLFCETDQKLVCLVCKEGKEHRCHRFKPATEVAKIYKGELQGAFGFLSKENKELDDLIKKQTVEITKTEEKSKSLSAKISAEFEEMHQFLRKREEEVKKGLENEERNAVETMQNNRSVIVAKLREGNEMEVIMQSALEINQPGSFLQWWKEDGLPLVEGMKQKDIVDKTEYRSKVKGLSVTPDSLTLGPYETHLPFFVWKKMFGSIKSVPHRNTVKDVGDPDLRVSPGGLSVQRAQSLLNLFGICKGYRPLARTHATFQTGRHYWEVEVGGKLDWAVGLCVESKPGTLTEEVMLVYNHEKGYSVKIKDDETHLDIEANPRRIGVFLDCGRSKVSFYDADNMSLIHMSCDRFSVPLSLCLSPGEYLDGDPLTVCCY